MTGGDDPEATIFFRGVLKRDPYRSPPLAFGVLHVVGIVLVPVTDLPGYEDCGGLVVETVGQRADFLPAWERIGQLVGTYSEPGRFVVFPGYEWHGFRTRYGDHNVIYQHVGAAAWRRLDARGALRQRARP